MYDYISLQPNSDFSASINIDKLQRVFNDLNGCRIRSNASAVVQFGDYEIIIQRIKCDKDANYAFKNDQVFKAVNLIEINIPQGAESAVESEIRQLATELARKIGWSIDWRE